MCEKYTGVLPSHLENETLDQLLCLVVPEAELVGLVMLDVGRGDVVPGAKPPPEGYASMAQYVRAKSESKREDARKAAHQAKLAKIAEKRRRRGK